MEVFDKFDAKLEALYVCKTHCTVRECAVVFKRSKSSIWTDLTVRLVYLDEELATKVNAILQENKCDRARRGGVQTQKIRRAKEKLCQV